MVLDALHDDLTGLPNAALLVDRLTQALARARRAGTWVGVIHLELDGAAGADGAQSSTASPGVTAAMVSEAAARLVRSLRDTDTCARIEARTFVVVCEDLSHPADGQLVEGRLTAALRRGVKVEGTRMHVTVRSGVAIGSIGGVPSALLESAAALATDSDAAGRLAAPSDVGAPGPVRGIGGVEPADV